MGLGVPLRAGGVGGGVGESVGEAWGVDGVMEGSRGWVAAALHDGVTLHTMTARHRGCARDCTAQSYVLVPGTLPVDS